MKKQYKRKRTKDENPTGYKRLAKRFYDSKKTKNMANSEMVAYFPNKRWNLPIPPRYKTSFVATNNGFTAAGGASAAGYFDVSLNGLQNPFQKGNALPNPALTVASDPIGYINLVDSDFYQQYRVYCSKIELTVTTSDLADQMGVVVMPTEDGAGASSYYQQLGRPLSKDAVISNQERRIIKNTVTIPTLAGTTTQAIKNDLSGEFNGSVAAVPNKLFNWRILWQNLSNVAATVGVVTYNVKVTYYAELFDLALQDIRR